MFCNQKIKIKGGMQAKAIFQSGTIFGEWLLCTIYSNPSEKIYNICVAYCLIERMEISKRRIIFLVCPVTDLAKKGKGLGSSITPTPPPPPPPHTHL